jgi:eukaryotic-like serine/threonine-protein kinase
MAGKNDPSAPAQSPRASVRRSIKSARVSVAPERVSNGSGDPHAPEVKDKFELHGLLGEGGMGSVFIAQDRRLGRIVALKVLRSQYDHDADLLRRFALEAQVGAQLEHPNIVPLYSLERADNGGPAFAMQLVEGINMSQYMNDAAGATEEARTPRGEYALKKRLTKLLGACDAMQFAHARGVVHRDLKPENIMLGAHHEVYVMDWGLARVTVEHPSSTPDTPDAPKPLRSTFDLAPTIARPPSNASASTVEQAVTHVRSSQAGAPGADGATAPQPPAAGRASAERSPSAPEHATQYGAVMGTYQYMPPEQAMGMLDLVGPATDQYALGLILLELGTLQPARSYTSAAEAHSEALLNRYRAGDDIDGKPLDPALLAIVERATQAEVAGRYPNVEALAEDVRRFIRDEPVSVYREGIAKRMLRFAARHPITVMCALSAVLILGAAAVIASLVQSAATARRAAHDLQGIKRLLVAVQSRAHEVDVRLSDYAAFLERAEAVAQEILGQETRADPRSVQAIADAPLPALAWNARYKTNINFHAPLITWAGRAQGAAPPASLPAVKRISPWLRDALVATLPPDSVAPTETAEDNALEAGRSPLLRVALGLHDGVYAQFPARELPDSYDVRKRQWYRMAIAARSLGWHPPVAGPQGRTLRLPALLPIRRGAEVLGAVAADLLVEELAQTLLLSDMPGFVDAYLATQEGKVVVRRGLAAQVLKPGSDADADIVLPTLANAALAASIAEGKKGGYVEGGGRLHFFARMISPAWYYIAEFERAPYLSGALPAGEQRQHSLASASAAHAASKRALGRASHQEPPQLVAGRQQAQRVR